jgi:stage V sporulation protein B
MGGVVVYTLLINLALNYDLVLLRHFAGAALPEKEAGALAGSYVALRALALLPYQALLVVTFVIFPLVSRSTFAEDHEATRAYIGQTLRYALIVGAAMAVVLGARPSAILGILFPKEYLQQAAALPVLAAGIVALALLSVVGSIVNASGRPQVAVVLVATTVVVGAVLMAVLVPAAPAGPPMLLATATAAALGFAAGLAVALVYLRRRFSAGPPLATVLRVLAAAALAAGAGRVIPGGGKLVGLFAIAVVGVVFVAALIALREFGPQDRAKVGKILRRRG